MIREAFCEEGVRVRVAVRFKGGFVASAVNFDHNTDTELWA